MFAGGFWSEVLHLLPLTLRQSQSRAWLGGFSVCPQADVHLAGAHLWLEVGVAVEQW